jgi:hypothetical protein
MNKEAKATEYRIRPLVKLLRSEAIIDGGTRKKAEALGGTWIKLNEYEYILEEEGKVTRVYSDGDTVGCACNAFSDPMMNVLCEHIIKFEALKSPPQLTIESPDYRWLRTYLMGLEWYAENRYLYPPLGEGLPEDEASWKPDEEEPAKLDPANEDHDLDIGVDEDTEEKTYSRDCKYCGEIISGTDLAQVKQDIAEHTSGCPKNPANKKRSQANDVTVDETEVPIVPKKEDKKVAPEKTKEKKKVKPPSKKTVSLYDWVENLIEFGVGQIFGDTGTAKTAFCREVAEQAADEGKKVVYWDSEGNMTRAQRAAMTEHKNITYILDRDWAHIKNMLSSELSKGSPKLGKCDLFVLDSIGVPVLGIYGTLKQNQKGNALQAMQGLLYELTKFAETNEAVVIVTNQPVSEMNKNEAERADRHPFGDKAMFFTKEILKIVPGERTEYKTVCHIMAWRSRSAGRGKMLCTVTVSDSGVEVTPTGGE